MPGWAGRKHGEATALQCDAPAAEVARIGPPTPSPALWGRTGTAAPWVRCRYLATAVVSTAITGHPCGAIVPPALLPIGRERFGTFTPSPRLWGEGILRQDDIAAHV